MTRYGITRTSAGVVDIGEPGAGTGIDIEYLVYVISCVSDTRAVDGGAVMALIAAIGAMNDMAVFLGAVVSVERWIAVAAAARNDAGAPGGCGVGGDRSGRNGSAAGMAVDVGTAAVAIAWFRSAAVGAAELGCEGNINLMVYVQGSQFATAKMALRASCVGKTSSIVTNATDILVLGSGKIIEQMLCVTAGCYGRSGMKTGIMAGAAFAGN